MDTTFLRQYAKTRRFLAGRPVQPEFALGNKAVLFLRSPAQSPVQTLYALEVATGQSRELLTPQTVLQGAAETLSTEERARLERQRVSARGFTSYRLSKDGEKAALSLGGKLYVVELSTQKSRALPTGEASPIDPRFSADGKKLAYVRNADLYVADWAKGQERRLTQTGSPTRVNGLAEFIAQEEMSRFEGFWWAPDGQTLAFQETDTSLVEQFRIQDAFHPESEPDVFAYPRAGKPNAQVRLGLLPVGGGKPVWVSWDAQKYPYLATVKWSAHGPLTLVVQDRAQQEEQVLSVDVKTGQTRTLLVEKDAAWLNLDQDFPEWLEDGSGFLWLTERNGAPEVELRKPDGTLAFSWVRPEAGFRKLAGVDVKSKSLYFLGTPTVVSSALFRAAPGKAPELVALEGVKGGWADATLSEDGQSLVVTHTSLRAMPRTTVFQATTGKKLGELPSVAEEPSAPLNVELRTVAVGEGHHVALFRPRGKAVAGKLPVILSVYGGPGLAVVRDVMREHLLAQWYADQGFLVVKVDNRGTPHRTRAFERAIRGDFSSVILDDQVAVLKALAKDVPELDLTRVGIEGWSFGGYLSALAVLKRPDVFKAAVAGAPVVDWADYDTHYTERYLGLPVQNPKGYEASSLLSYASRLERPLLLIHGTADDNVYFLHTLKLSDALFKAGKAHEVLPLSGFTHMVPDPLTTERLYERAVGFLKQHVQGPSQARPQ
jgi:dipeptidyl-peptidase 4